MKTTHTHHIIPKHMGGTNDPNNLIELTPEQHALAHKKLFEKYGKWEDKIAWEMLSGQINNYEAQQQVRRLANLGISKSKESNLKNSFNKKKWWSNIQNKQRAIKNMMGRTNRKGIKFTPEQKRKISESLKGNTNKLGKTGYKLSAEFKEKARLRWLGNKNIAKRPDVREKLRLAALRREALKRQLKNNIYQAL